MRRAGVTLVELLVVLMILGLIAGVSGLAFTSLRATREAAWVRTLRATRAQAIRTGKPAQVSGSGLTSSALGGPRRLLFLPDGRALGPGVDPLTGSPRDSLR